MKKLRVNEHGELVIPRELVDSFGLAPGAEVGYEEQADSLLLHRPTSHLHRIYVEATNLCNLNCTTCVRHVWNAPFGEMDERTFARVLEAVEALPAPPTVFFGGYGEPLFHPRILEMIRAVKARGARAELITNGTLLTAEMSDALVELQLDFLWISIDGAQPESYQDVRGSESLPTLLKQIHTFLENRLKQRATQPQWGLAFVAMRRNIAELPDIIRIALNYDARRISVSNVLPYTAELNEERLYTRAMCGWRNDYLVLDLPRLDHAQLSAEVLDRLLYWFGFHGVAGQERERRIDRCPFVSRGSVSVRWDGLVSPCLPSLYGHEHYLGTRLRHNLAYHVGALRERPLLEIWRDPAYVALRERLLSFDFSPCTECNSCEMADTNEQDCMGSVLPGCGGCLWAQGFIRCP